LKRKSQFLQFKESDMKVIDLRDFQHLGTAPTLDAAKKMKLTMFDFQNVIIKHDVAFSVYCRRKEPIFCMETEEGYYYQQD
jgi:hypothetical protein